MACGGCHTVGVNREGNLVSWGHGAYGQLGHGKNHKEDIMTEPEVIDKTLFSKQVQRVACGLCHTCVLTTEGELYSW